MGQKQFRLRREQIPSYTFDTAGDTAGETARLRLHGGWRIHGLDKLELHVEPRGTFRTAIVACDGLTALDTAGALAALDLAHDLFGENAELSLQDCSDEQQTIFNLAAEHRHAPSPLRNKTKRPLLEAIGFRTLRTHHTLVGLLNFVGRTLVESLHAIVNPLQFRLKEFVAQLQAVCLDALVIVALVMLLIGIVLAYLFSIQIEKYGANIFIVDAVGLATCRELSPIIVAIIVAGRSGSAFTAHIGAMKINEELDALVTLGLSVFRVLIIPRMLALMIALPLLVFVGDVVGIFGSMLIADARLGITMPTFFDRLQAVLPVRSFLVGFIKAPVFAAFIAMIGCRMGLNVERDARSLGLATTATVVQSIVSVILLNAAFAVIFVELGI